MDGPRADADRGGTTTTRLENHQVYGPCKVWQQMGREILHAARCRVRRLMREMGLAGAVRGRAWVTTTQVI
jgi:transposase InsO family protein